MQILITALFAALISVSLHAQARPEVNAQRTAMEKLNFLAGTWTGEAVISFGPDKQITIHQTEEVRYKLDGLVIVIEGTGRDASDKVVFNAIAVVSFEPKSGTYRIRAWNNGNFVESEMKVSGNSFDWSFQQGSITMTDVMKVDQQGRWSETSEATSSDGRKLHSVKMLLTRQQ